MNIDPVSAAIAVGVVNLVLTTCAIIWVGRTSRNLKALMDQVRDQAAQPSAADERRRLSDQLL
jgi:ribosomal silencing factor RsfS